MAVSTSPGDGTATDFDPSGAPGFGAYALDVAPDGTLYVGGSSPTFDLAYQQGFAQFSPPDATAPECS